jgi:hypothetical protein
VSSDAAAWVAIAFVAVIGWPVIPHNWRTFAIDEWQMEVRLRSLPGMLQSLPGTIVRSGRSV